MRMEKFSLKWNDFTNNASKAFSSLRNEDYLHNVTLVSNDNQQVSAHKLVLSACSEYFRNIFKNNPTNYPFLCMDGVTKEDLTNILDYMYNGEVHVYQDDLDRFLNIAERLKLQGLLGGSGSEDDKIENNSRGQIDLLSKEEVVTHFETPSETETINKSTPTSSKNEIARFDKVTIPISAEDLNEIEEKVSQYVEKLENKRYMCTICGKEAERSRNLKNHIETHMEGLSFPCSSCGRTFRSSHSLYKHSNRTHK